MKRLAELSLAHKGRMEQTYEEHMAILNCMKNGDTSRIYEITLKHMKHRVISIWKICKKNRAANFNCTVFPYIFLLFSLYFLFPGTHIFHKMLLQFVYEAYHTDARFPS